MEISVSSYKKIDRLWWLLRLTYGLVPVVAGLDKVLGLNFLVRWSQYLSSIAQSIIPLEAATIMQGVGIIEIVAGLMVLAGLTRLGGMLVMIWLLLIAANLFSMGLFFDVAVRDIVMAVGALALVWLTDVKNDLES